MSKNEKKISISAIDRVLKDMEYNENDTVQWNGLDVVVKKRLSLVDVAGFAASVAGNCVSRDTGEYRPEFYDFMIANNIIEYYTNISMPEDAEKRYAMICAIRPLISEVLAHIDNEQYNNLIGAIDLKIAYIANSNIDAAIRKVNDAYNSLNEFVKTTAEMIEGVDPELFNNFINAVSENGIDEGKLMSAYLSSVGSDNSV